MRFRWWLLVTVFVFAAGLTWGLTHPAVAGTSPPEEITALQKLAEFLAQLPKPYFLLFIFLKNISAVAISFVLSPFLCAMPVFTLFLNGWLIGFISTSVIEQKSLGYLLGGLLPHGIFEIPALLIGEAAALSFGVAVLMAIFSEQRRKLLVPNLKQNLRYLAISLVLFLVAAVIETFVTPLFLS